MWGQTSLSEKKLFEVPFDAGSCIKSSFLKMFLAWKDFQLLDNVWDELLR